MEGLASKISALGNNWEGAGAKRVYFNDLEKIYGLEFLADEDGKIINVTLDGDRITLKQGVLLRRKLAVASIWFDFEKLTFHYKNIDGVLANHLIDEIRKQISGDNHG